MTIDVLIPVYNQGGLVLRALESIPNLPNLRIIICDDGSVDDTYVNVVEWAEKSPIPTKVLINTENRGVAYTMNKLYDHATADYVVALGSDDYFTEGFAKATEELDGTDLVYFDLEINDGTVFHLSQETKLDYCGSTKFIRKDFLGESKCSDKEAGEDLDLYLDLLSKEPTEKFTGIVAKHYNFPREDSLSWRLRAKEALESEQGE